MGESELRKAFETYFGPVKQNSVLDTLMALAEKYATENK